MLAAGCQTRGPIEPVSEFESLQDASDAYLAYSRNDCDTVFQLTQLGALEFWQPSDLRDAMYLVRGFCKELRNDRRGAKEAYGDLIAMSPTSFAGLDARERMRLINLRETDPNFTDLIEDARARALGDRAERAPIERQNAVFPPVPRAAGVEGYALVEFGVTPKGQTSDAMIIESSPPFVFDGSALRAVRRWEYARKPGSSTLDRQVIRLTFVTDDSVSPESAQPLGSPVR